MSSEHAWSIGNRTAEILHSCKVNAGSFASKKLKLCQTFCLLWQNKETGDVYGRQKCGALTNAATAAVLLDLFAARKIRLDCEMRKWMDKKRQVVNLKVVDPTPTGTFLDDALFSDILEHHEDHPSGTKTIVEWMVQGDYRKPDNTATVVLESLVKDEILGRESKLFGRRYPLINSELKNNLEEEIREIALCGQQPDDYMWCLLKLLFAADECFGRKAPLLSRYFHGDELVAVLDCIDALPQVKPANDKQMDGESEQFELDIVH